MARRIAKLTEEGLTGHDLLMGWFTRRIQPLQYHRRLIWDYSRTKDPLRVTEHDLPSDSLTRRIKTLYKVPRGQNILEITHDIYTKGECPKVSIRSEHISIYSWRRYF
jgi:hypothetical protein